MSTAIDLFADVAAVGAASVGITKRESDLFTAAGYAAWTRAVTGRPPKVVNNDGQALLVLDDDQVKVFREWFVSLTRPPAVRPTVKLELGPVLKPLALRSAAIAVAGGFAAGFLISRMFR